MFSGNLEITIESGGANSFGFGGFASIIDTRSKGAGSFINSSNLFSGNIGEDAIRISQK